MKALGVALVAAVVVAAPRLALACPVCAGNENSGGAMRVVALGFMILLPFVIAAVVIGVIRSISREGLTLPSEGPGGEI